MIGIFDSGSGGLSILEAAKKQIPDMAFAYHADYAHMPYGGRAVDDIIQLTKNGVQTLFDQGCHLVILGCNTATAVALRPLQQNWLPTLKKPRNILGIIAPTVEAIADLPAQHQPRIALFATPRTVASNVFEIELTKRRPDMMLQSIACPDLAALIEKRMALNNVDNTAYIKNTTDIKNAITHAFDQLQDIPTHIILGCTHYALVHDMFVELAQQRALLQTLIIDQPSVVAASLQDYLTRHPEYI